MYDVNLILEKLTFHEKCMLLTGSGALRTGEVNRVGISHLEFSDGPHGIRRLLGHPTYPQNCNIEGGDTAFPTASAMGASWSAETVFQVGEAIAKDCLQEGIDMLLAPGINMKRTPHCGRNFEYFSEDPYHTGILAASFIKGVQSKGIGTSLKHYAANNQEFQRGTINVEVDERTLREYYLKAFEIVLQHCNPTSVMCSYNKLNGIWCSENKYLLTELLRETWKYDGLIVSDWGAIHNISRALNAGMDLQMPRNADIQKQIQWGLDHKIISMKEVDRSVKKILCFMNKLLDMRQNIGDYDRKAQHKVAYKAACECITLLRNDQNILPITRDKYKRIAILGTCAQNPVFMGGGSSAVTVEAKSVDSPLFYLQNNDLGIEVDYFSLENVLGKESIVGEISKIGAYYDAVIYFVGDHDGTDVETESFDRDNLYFPNYINAAIQSGISSNPNFVLVLQTGSAIIPRDWSHVPALIEMWYAGEAGGKAIADILFGKINPSGKLSETFILNDRTDIDYPGDGTKICYREKYEVGYRYYDRHPNDVWFPFGHGLSYTEYLYSDLKLSKQSIDSAIFDLDISFCLKNNGMYDGKEIVQLYIASLDNVVDRPTKELKRFAKIALKSGEKQNVYFTLTQSDFAYFNTCLHDWHVESGRYRICISSSSAKTELSDIVEIRYINDYTIHSTDTSMVL